jgi:prophage antirepressor-like protein
MDSIVKFACDELDGTEIECVLVKGEPWFKAKQVAEALGYIKTKQAIQINVDDEDKKQYKDLDVTSHGPIYRPVGGTVSNAVYVNESGLYSLILRSTKPEAKVFKRWVTSQVLPAIRKTGSYNTYRYSRNKSELGNTASERWKKVRELAVGKEDELHYKIVKHIRHEYPDAQPLSGLGEHLSTDHSRMDAYLKGYTKGHPDIIILRKLPNAFQDVLAIELKNPNGKGVLDDTQVKYHKLLKEQCNIETIVDHEYDKIIIKIALHYQDVFARAQLPALTDKPQNYDFSKNSDPQYWCNKLKNKQCLIDECTKREIPHNDIRIKTNREIASILITFDTKA